MPEEYRRHEAMLLFHWTEREYEEASAQLVDWAFAIEAAKAEVSEKKQAQGG